MAAKRRGGNDNRQFDADRKAEFLRELAATGRRTDARNAVGISARTITYHLSPDSDRYDPEFAAGYEEAMQEYRDALVREAHRRAVEGVPEPVYYQGARVKEKDGREAVVLKYSDRMLELLLKRHIPEFRDRTTVDQTVKHEGRVELADLKQLPRDDRQVLRELLLKAEERRGGDPSNN